MPKNKKNKSMSDDEYVEFLMITENLPDFTESDEDIRNGQEDNYFLDED